jgi:calcineurin-like phosphoesterase family protein
MRDDSIVTGRRPAPFAVLVRCHGDRRPGNASIMAIRFTADTHFGDHRTLNIHRRPFASVAAMDAALVAAWNDAVAPDDDVWHLGDVARRLSDVAGLLAALHGTKHLLRGNNDDPAIGDVPGWASVRDYAEITVDDFRLVLCHYPLRSWNGQHRGAIDLHGHSHGRLKPMPRQFDVGVDARDWRPVTLAALLATG